MFGFEIEHQGADRLVELLNKDVLVELRLVVSIPPGPIDEIEMEGHFNKTGAAFDQAPGEQAASARASAGSDSTIRSTCST